MYIPRSVFVDAVSSMVRKLTCVQTLSVWTLDAAATEYIGSISTLASLNIGHVDEPLFPADSATHAMFQSLRSLSVHPTHVGLWTNIFRSLSKPPLNDFFGGTQDSATEEQSFALFSAIHDHLDHTSLTVIDIDLGHFTGVEALNPEPYTVQCRTLRPVLAFQNMTVVRVEPVFRICLDDEFVEAMAVAWPCILRNLIPKQVRCMQPFSDSTRLPRGHLRVCAPLPPSAHALHAS
ncbi:hypothetical protein C8R44DRAFT_767111 [Mycena epipterygia]|nr:hypothetical protein C8R44DRAFT_767111 [Mycena epipterygia]